MTESNLEFDIDPAHLWKDTDGKMKDWETVKDSSLLFPASSYGEMKKFIIDECNDAKNCTGLEPKNFSAIKAKFKKTDRFLKGHQ